MAEIAVQADTRVWRVRHRAGAGENYLEVWSQVPSGIGINVVGAHAYFIDAQLFIYSFFKCHALHKQLVVTKIFPSNCIVKPRLCRRLDGKLAALANLSMPGKRACSAQFHMHWAIACALWFGTITLHFVSQVVIRCHASNGSVKLDYVLVCVVLQSLRVSMDLVNATAIPCGSDMSLTRIGFAAFQARSEEAPGA